jgi:hypothetical protein
VPEAQLAEIVELRRPVHFQVSLEGQRDYDDHIRGAGHFQRVMEFLPLLRKWKVKSQVMLTLHKGNMEQLLPLAQELRGQVDGFTFTRLSQVGAGATMALPEKPQYIELLERYTVASRTNPHLKFKDGLFNILRHHFFAAGPALSQGKPVLPLLPPEKRLRQLLGGVARPPEQIFVARIPRDDPDPLVRRRIRRSRGGPQSDDRDLLAQTAKQAQDGAADPAQAAKNHGPRARLRRMPAGGHRFRRHRRHGATTCANAGGPSASRYGFIG